MYEIHIACVNVYPKQQCVYTSIFRSPSLDHVCVPVCVFCVLHIVLSAVGFKLHQPADEKKKSNPCMVHLSPNIFQPSMQLSSLVSV